MPMISKDIFIRLMNVYNVDTLKELSETLGFKQNWATSTRKREGIPFEACAIASEKMNVSMDYLLFGESVDENGIDISKLKISVTEALFTVIQTDMITLGKDIKITDVIESITSEVASTCNVKHEKQLKKVQ